ncbi:hypothetical protein [Actinopolymorpha singaporensis]|nr:hypothetical protein [Actinopolymorpha singaporensis]
MTVALVADSSGLVEGLFAFVGGLFTPVSVAVTPVGFVVALVCVALAVVCESFPLVGFAVALVGDCLPFVSDSFTFVGIAVAFVGLVVALVTELVSLVAGARTFVGFDVSKFFEPTAGVGRHVADVGLAVPFFGGVFAAFGGGGAFVPCSAAPRGGLILLGREESPSLRRSLPQPRRERARLGGSLPEGQGDPLPSGDLDRFVLPTVVGGGHVFNVARRAAELSQPRQGDTPWAGLARWARGGRDRPRDAE